MIFRIIFWDYSSLHRSQIKMSLQFLPNGEFSACFQIFIICCDLKLERNDKIFLLNGLGLFNVRNIEFSLFFLQWRKQIHVTGTREIQARGQASCIVLISLKSSTKSTLNTKTKHFPCKELAPGRLSIFCLSNGCSLSLCWCVGCGNCCWGSTPPAATAPTAWTGHPRHSCRSCCSQSARLAESLECCCCVGLSPMMSRQVLHAAQARFSLHPLSCWRGHRTGAPQKQWMLAANKMLVQALETSSHCTLFRLGFNLHYTRSGSAYYPSKSLISCSCNL